MRCEQKRRNGWEAKFEKENKKKTRFLVNSVMKNKNGGDERGVRKKE